MNRSSVARSPMLRVARGWWMLAVLLLATVPLQAQAHTILVLGDSLSAAYGIPRKDGWVALLQQKLPHSQIINAGISGDTTDGGLRRLPDLLRRYRPDIAILELGANDGLRGFQIQRIRNNLGRLITLCQKADAKVLLVGIKIPPNYGLRYTTDFYETYTLAAKKFDVPLVPFLLAGVALNPDLMQKDGLHPNVAAQPKLLATVWKYLQPML